MAARKKATKTSVARKPQAPVRRTRGRVREEGASFPVAPPRSELPRDYGATLAEIKQRIGQERVRVALAANSAMGQVSAMESDRRIFKRPRTT